jgi:L,D-transpeptidase catalytic domain
MRRRVVILAAALAWLISIESAEARLDILVDKATQRMLVIQNGYMRYIWPVSTGRDETATPNGVYTPQRLERNWFSNAYYNSPMPYSIFFHNGYAIHGSYAINQLGGPASHGCVRLHPHHAALLFDLVQQEGPDKTTIEVADEARPNEPSLPGREIAAERGSYPPALYPPVPRIVRYREPGEMPELPPVQRGNRPIAARNPLPPRPPPAGPPPSTVGRRLLAEVRPPAPANAPRAPCGAGEASDESSDCRPKPKVAEASPPEPAQRAPSALKLLPASCWSGGASRWKWWGSSQGAPCR